MIGGVIRLSLAKLDFDGGPTTVLQLDDDKRNSELFDVITP